MITCPIDQTSLRESQSHCPTCGMDLSLFISLEQLPQRLYNEGLQRARSGDLDTAIETLAAAAALAPDMAEPRVVLGKVYAQQGRFEQAVATWRQALTIDPGNHKASAGMQAAEALLRSTQGDDSRSRLLSRLMIAGGLVVALLAGIGLSLGWQAPHGPAPTPLATQATPLPATATPAPTLPLDQIRQALSNDPLTAYKVEAQAAGLGVHLAGSVPNQALKTLAEQRVRSIAGGALVDSIDLQVVPDRLVEAVQAALSSDATASDLKLILAAAGAEGVALHGSVPSAELKRHVEALASSIPNVHFVDSSDVTVVPPVLDVAVRAPLDADSGLASLSIEVEQRDRGILLRGTVPQPELKARAETLAKAVKGVELVDSSGLAIIPPQAAEYEVQSGDTLWLIAEQVYGTPSRWRDLYEANRDLISNPNMLRTGMRLRVP